MAVGTMKILLPEGEDGPAPLSITILSVPYDNQKEAEAAKCCPGLLISEGCQKEVLTGVYSR